MMMILVTSIHVFLMLMMTLMSNYVTSGSILGSSGTSTTRPTTTLTTRPPRFFYPDLIDKAITLEFKMIPTAVRFLLFHSKSIAFLQIHFHYFYSPGRRLLHPPHHRRSPLRGHRLQDCQQGVGVRLQEGLQVPVPQQHLPAVVPF